jgi:hypothetical protein
MLTSDLYGQGKFERDPFKHRARDTVTMQGTLAAIERDLWGMPRNAPYWVDCPHSIPLVHKVLHELNARYRATLPASQRNGAMAYYAMRITPKDGPVCLAITRLV